MAAIKPISWGCSLLLLFSFVASEALGQAKGQQATKATTDPLKALSRSYDKMRGITWYKSPRVPKFGNAFYLYFGKEDSGQFLPLRLNVFYFADDWLFIKRAWAKADGVVVDVPQKSDRLSGWERDNAGGKIFEWSDAALTTPSEIASVRRISQAKNVTVRFEGKYYEDRTLTAAELKALRDVIAAYEAATGKPWK